MVSLDRAVALSEVDHIAVLVREDLELDMARMLDKMLNIHRIIAECHLRLFLRRIEAVLELFRSLRHTHALAAAAERSLHDNRVADLLCYLRSRLCIKDGLRAARYYRNTRIDHRISCLGLIAQALDDLGFRSDKCYVALFAQFCKSAVLRKKTESRMDSVRSGDHRRADDVLHIQVTLRGRRRPDAHRLIGKLCVQGVSVRLRVDGHCFDPHFPARADDAHGDFTAVCDQYFSNHFLTPLP